MQPRAVIFDVGDVLYHWDPRNLYGRLIEDDRALDAFLETVVTRDWHFQHDQGRSIEETVPERIAQFPQHEALIRAWAARFQESFGPPVAGMIELVEDLDAAGVPLYAITNFSHEFWPAFRAARESVFARFRGVVVSGAERVWKPNPEIYALARERFGLAPGEAVFVDDVAANAEAATRSGIIGIHFTGAPALRAKLTELGLLAP